jgi:hypothetical protein
MALVYQSDHPRSKHLFGLVVALEPTSLFSLIPSYLQLLVTRFAASTTHGQLSAAKGSSTTVSRSDTIQLT